MTRVAIMQPYFFPWLGYFSLIKHADQFVLFDPVQFIRHGWIERNRVLKQNEGWLYIKVPLIKQPLETLIKDTLIDDSQPWRQKLLAQLATYKKLSRRYDDVYGLVEAAIAPPFTSIVALNQHTLQAVCRYLGFEKPLPIWSEMNLDIEAPTAADEWALNTCKALGGVDEYWNPPGGRSFFDPAKYERAGIKLKFHEQALRPYNQRREPFEPGLSIIDVMMQNPIEVVNEMLDEYALT
jgi:hypothetical protein